MADTSIAILAGGKSSRMKQDKSFVLLDGKPLIQHVIERVNQLDLPVILIANQPQKYQRFGLPIFPDVIPDKGSLGGIYTALMQSQTEHVLCVACDMPFLHPPLLNHLIEISGEADAIVPHIDGKTQALHAVYGQTCCDVLLDHIQRDALKIRAILRTLNALFVEEGDLPPALLRRESFVNLNTPDELAAHATSPG